MDAGGNAYVAGFTTSSNFPLTSNRLADASPGGGFVAKLNPSGTALMYSTKLPGVGGATAIAVDGLNQVHAAGYANGTGLPVVLKLGARGDQLLFATYLGGSGGDGISGLALDTLGNIYVTGSTNSSDFPFTSGSLDLRPREKKGYADAFVAKLNQAGKLLYAASPSGSCHDRPASIAVDRSGRAFLTGSTARPITRLRKMRFNARSGSCRRWRSSPC